MSKRRADLSTRGSAASGREIWMPKRKDITIQGMLAALGDPIRLEIVRQMAQHGELRPTDFLVIGSKQNLTHHLRVLRDAGLLNARYEGRNKVMWLRRDLIDDIAPGLLDGVLRALSSAGRGNNL